jgi:hypothetical protein
MGTMDNGLSHSSYIAVAAATVSRRSAASACCCSLSSGRGRGPEMHGEASAP